MSHINPLSGALLQSVEIQKRQSLEKSRLERKNQDDETALASQDDELEHQVGDSVELQPVHDQEAERRKRKPPPKKPADQDDAPPQPGTLDLTA